MKLVILSTLSLLAIHPALASETPAKVCPIEADGEKALDCPWASITRTLLAEPVSTEADAALNFAKHAPKIERQIAKDQARKTWLALWGKSINYDELARGTIVEPVILDPILARAGVEPRNERLVHAGIEHTYGYLFSVLKTPYGFKRARWVEDDIEGGFGLPRGTLGPQPKQGTLFANLTYFTGRIALYDVPSAMKALREGATRGVSKAVTGFRYDSLEIVRVEETLQSPRAVTLRTDFVKFPVAREGKKNTHLLIYSIKDESDAANPVKLITAFPVETSFVTNGSTQGLGDDVVVQTRYNAHVEGITGANPALKGSKKVVQR